MTAAGIRIDSDHHDAEPAAYPTRTANGGHAGTRERDDSGPGGGDGVAMGRRDCSHRFRPATVEVTVTAAPVAGSPQPASTVKPATSPNPHRLPTAA